MNRKQFERYRPSKSRRVTEIERRAMRDYARIQKSHDSCNVQRGSDCYVIPATMNLGKAARKKASRIARTTGDFFAADFVSALERHIEIIPGRFRRDIRYPMFLNFEEKLERKCDEPMFDNTRFTRDNFIDSRFAILDFDCEKTSDARKAAIKFTRAVRGILDESDNGYHVAVDAGRPLKSDYFRAFKASLYAVAEDFGLPVDVSQRTNIVAGVTWRGNVISANAFRTVPEYVIADYVDRFWDIEAARQEHHEAHSGKFFPSKAFADFLYEKMLDTELAYGKTGNSKRGIQQYILRCIASVIGTSAARELYSRPGMDDGSRDDTVEAQLRRIPESDSWGFIETGYALACLRKYGLYEREISERLDEVFTEWSRRRTREEFENMFAEWTADIPRVEAAPGYLTESTAAIKKIMRSGRIPVLAAGTGNGKTVLLSNLANDEWITYSPTRTLRDQNGDEISGTHACYASALRVISESDIYESPVAMDEVALGLTQVFTSSLGGNDKVSLFRRLSQQIYSAPSVIAAQARPAPHVVALLHRIRGVTIIGEERANYNRPKKVYAYENSGCQKSVIDACIHDVRSGNRVAFATTDKGVAKRVARLMPKGYNALLVTADTVHDEAQNGLIVSPKKLQGDYLDKLDVSAVVFSPAMGTGVSLDRKSGIVNLYAVLPHHGAELNIQMLNRVRFDVNELHVTVGTGVTCPRVYTKKDALKEVSTRYKALGINAVDKALVEAVSGNDTAAADYLDFLACQMLYDTYQEMFRRELVYETLGVTQEDIIDSSVLRVKLRSVVAEIEQDELQDVLNAEPAPGTVHEIIDGIEQGEFNSPEKRGAAVRGIVRELAGRNTDRSAEMYENLHITFSSVNRVFSMFYAAAATRPEFDEAYANVLKSRRNKLTFIGKPELAFIMHDLFREFPFLVDVLYGTYEKYIHQYNNDFLELKKSPILRDLYIAMGGKQGNEYKTLMGMRPGKSPMAWLSPLWKLFGYEYGRDRYSETVPLPPELYEKAGYKPNGLTPPKITMHFVTKVASKYRPAFINGCIEEFLAGVKTRVGTNT